MIAFPISGKASPVTWVGSFPVYLATLIAGLHALAVIFVSLTLAISGTGFDGGLLGTLVFSWKTAVLRGEIWQFVTYVFVAPPSLWIVVELFMLVVFGVEVEKFLGRRAFLGLYAALVLAGPVLLCALGGLAGVSWPLHGGNLAHFCVFLAFVMIHPRVPIFFGLQAVWVAVALVGIFTLQGLAGRDFMSVLLLWWTALVALGYLAGMRMSLPWPRWRSGRRVRRQVRPSKSRDSDVHEAIDPILEKIARQGLSSLTRQERARLQGARAALLQKDRQGGS